jgi:hypothetical protein
LIGYAADDIGEPGLRIKIDQPGGLDERVNDGGAASAFVRRDVMMPGVWAVRSSSSILSIRYSRSRRWSSPIGCMAALVI